MFSELEDRDIFARTIETYSDSQFSLDFPPDWSITPVSVGKAAIRW